MHTLRAVRRINHTARNILVVRNAYPTRRKAAVGTEYAPAFVTDARAAGIGARFVSEVLEDHPALIPAAFASAGTAIGTLAHHGSLPGGDGVSPRQVQTA